jgi:hypothetical protein
MSPTYFAVRCAQLDKEIKAARLAAALPRWQYLISRRRRLLERYYGAPLA